MNSDRQPAVTPDSWLLLVFRHSTAAKFLGAGDFSAPLPAEVCPVSKYPSEALSKHYFNIVFGWGFYFAFAELRLGKKYQKGVNSMIDKIIKGIEICLSGKLPKRCVE